MRKRSNIVLITIGLCFILGLSLYANHIKNSIKPQPDRFGRGIEIVRGEEFIKTFDLSYSHLHVSFPTVKIDGRYANHIELSRFAQARDIAFLDVCNDTLYISYSEQYTPKMVGTNAEIGLDIHVGGVGLKSITVSNEGSISTPVRPIGSKKNGKVMYNQADIERYSLIFDTLNTVGGPISLTMLDGEVLNMNKLKGESITNSLSGVVDNVNVEYDGSGQFNLMADPLLCDNVRINANKNSLGHTEGNFYINPTKSLTANLYGALDVHYNTDPIITKYERSTGRLIRQPED